MIYYNCVYQGDVYYINQNVPRAHFNPNAFEVSITNIVSNIYRNVNKFLPNTIIFLLDKDFNKVIYLLQ